MVWYLIKHRDNFTFMYFYYFWMFKFLKKSYMQIIILIYYHRGNRIKHIGLQEITWCIYKKWLRVWLNRT